MADAFEFHKEEIMLALNGLAETIKTAYRNDDVEMYASAFDDDAIVSIPGKPPVRGLHALKEMFVTRPALPPGATFEVMPTELEVINGDWAYAFGTDTLMIPSASGGEPLVETMTFMVLIRRTPQGWKTFREVVSADQSR